MEHRGKAIALTERERAAHHFGVELTEVTAEMIEQLPPRGTGLKTEKAKKGGIIMETRTCAMGGVQLQEEFEAVEMFAKAEVPLQKELLRHLNMLSYYIGVIAACGVPVEKVQNHLDAAVEATADENWQGARQSIESCRDAILGSS
jgi:hypothetical protein